MMTQEQIDVNVAKIKQLQDEIDAIKDASRKEFIESQREMVQLLFDGVMPVAISTSMVRRGRPKGSATGTRQPRSVESRFAVALTRLMNSTAIPSVTPDRQEAEKLLNSSADRVAQKNDCVVPESVWEKIDLHLTTHYGPKEQVKSKGKAKTAEAKPAEAKPAE